MKSNKLLGIFVVFFAVQVWSSDNKENLENKIEIETDESDIEFQVQLEQMIENLTGKSNLKTNEDTCDHDLVLDLSNLNPKDIKPDVFKYWSYIKFPSKGHFYIAGNWKDVKYFQFNEEEDTTAFITIENIDDGINLDPNRHHFPKIKFNFHIHSCKIISLRFPEGTWIKYFWFYFDKTNKIPWESIDLPKVTHFIIVQPFVSVHKENVKLKDIEKIQNATHVECLVLDNFYISELNLHKFNNLKELKIIDCYFDRHSKIVVSNKTEVPCGFKKCTGEILKDDTGTFVTYTYKEPECTYKELDCKQNEAGKDQCLIL